MIESTVSLLVVEFSTVMTTSSVSCVGVGILNLFCVKLWISVVVSYHMFRPTVVSNVPWCVPRVSRVLTITLPVLPPVCPLSVPRPQGIDLVSRAWGGTGSQPLVRCSRVKVGHLVGWGLGNDWLGLCSCMRGKMDYTWWVLRKTSLCSSNGRSLVF